jgi:putative hemolysin
MESSLLLYSVLLFLCLVLSAFFSSSETAFIALQKIRVKHMESSGIAGAGRVVKMMKRPERFLATILLGNNFTNTAAAALGTIMAVSFLGKERGVLAATIGITLLLLVFGETTPKTIAARHAERMALLYIRPIEVISWLLYPFAAALGWLSFQISRLARGTPVSSPLLSAEEIRTAISIGHAEGVVEDTEAKMLHKVLEFGDRPVREIMTPRTEVAAIPREARLSDLLALYPNSPHSRFPVYEENIDNVVGILSIKDVMVAQSQGAINLDSPLSDLIRPAYFVPETKCIGEMFAEMQSQGYQMAIIIDEFGGTAGIVTLEQLVEEIVGELGDELARPGHEYESIDEHTFQIEGSLRVEEVNEGLKLQLPQGDYETVAGFLLHLLGHIPEEGEQVKYEGLKFVITGMRGRKIEKILITREQREDAAAAS